MTNLLTKAWDKLDQKVFQKYLGGHKHIGPVTIYGFNAMHVAVNVWSDTLGAYVCFHPTVRMNGRAWPWDFYVSRNATPWAAIVAFGPGLDGHEKAIARKRAELAAEDRLHLE